MHVLRNMVSAVTPGGLVLDLQVIRPNPRVEAGGRVICEIEGERLFATADAAAAGVNSFVADGRLVEDAVDDHDVLRHYEDGPDLIDDFADDEEQRIPDDAIDRVRALIEPCIVRERCRLRLLRVA